MEFQLIDIVFDKDYKLKSFSTKKKGHTFITNQLEELIIDELQGEFLKYPEQETGQIEIACQGKYYLATYSKKVRNANILIIPIDIYKFKLNEQQQERQLKADKNKKMQEVVDSIIHETNTPISSAIISLEIALQLLNKNNKAFSTVDRDKIHCLLDRTLSCVKKCSRTILELKNLFLDNSNRFIVSNINYIINTSFSLLENKLVEKNIKVIQEINESIDLECNEDLIKNVFQIMISNSIESLCEHGSNNKEKFIFVKSYASDNYVNILFGDNGHHIPILIQDKIFEQYFSSKSIKGNSKRGLGLSVAKKIIDIHAGDIFCCNNNDYYKFHIKIPKTQIAKK